MVRVVEPLAGPPAVVVAAVSDGLAGVIVKVAPVVFFAQVAGVAVAQAGWVLGGPTMATATAFEVEPP